MSDLKKIKEKLVNEDKVEDLLEAISCDYVKSEQGGHLITAQLPERFYSTNKRAVQVKMNEFMSCSIRNRADFEGDIFNLVNYIHFDHRGAELQQNLQKAKTFICELFGWTQYLKGKKGTMAVKDYTACLRQFTNNKKRRKEIKPNPILPETVLNEYFYWDQPLPFDDWVKEGISRETQIMYGIGFDLDTKRITVPIRNRFGKLVGVKGRIMHDKDDLEKKYIYLHRCNNGYEWFNFHFALPYILMEKKVFIFEGEKSCMKMFDLGVYNTLAIGASKISEEQVHTIKQLGLDIEIILCYDKGLKEKEIDESGQLFTNRKVYKMIDRNDLLNHKDSPIDKGFDVWKQMLEAIEEIEFNVEK
ncbi:hypothetical protein Q7A53_05455 [Halobacillus rhizosphaerae]|uniref:hypothetical protein n=1 Tax=Halobacillus rhizosphaerae TaxID=3064889 RepID=UPI00398B2A8E